LTKFCHICLQSTATSNSQFC